MPLDRLQQTLLDNIATLGREGRRKEPERIVREVIPAKTPFGPRYLLQGEGDKPFLRMNSNDYLGLSKHPKLIEAEEHSVRRFGVGPGAVRFISGTYSLHAELERQLALFHGREAAMIYSSAYAAVVSVITSLTTPETVIISDELNHNCIINGMRMARPLEKYIYRHCDLGDLKARLQACVGKARRVLVISDGIFSMRGVYAPLAEISGIVQHYDPHFPENVLLLVDDSHGVAAFGETGRGTEEFTGAKADLLMGTLGKGFGVNGGYVVGPRWMVEYLREVAPMYVYSNPITPPEAAAAKASLELVQSPEGQRRIAHLHQMTQRLRQGLKERGLETLEGAHPIIPLMVRDNARTTALVRFLHQNGILATAIGYPVVPKGDESIRFQVAADHTEADIDQVLQALGRFSAIA